MYGRLVWLDPAEGYVGYQGKAMSVLFRPTGSATWIHSRRTTCRKAHAATSSTFADGSTKQDSSTDRKRTKVPWL